MIWKWCSIWLLLAFSSCGPLFRHCVTPQKPISGNLVLGQDCQGEESGLWLLRDSVQQFVGGDYTQSGQLYFSSPDQILIDTTFIVAKNKEGQYFILQKSHDDSVQLAIQTKNLNRFIRIARKTNLPNAMLDSLIGYAQVE